MQELLEESNTLLEKMSTETGRAPTPTVRTFHFLLVQFACFGFLLLFLLSLTFFFASIFLLFFCFAICFSFPFLFCFTMAFSSRTRATKPRGNGKKDTFSFFLIPFAVVLLSDGHFWILKNSRSLVQC